MNKNFKAGAQGGFTLIELIVVIVILGILAATALPKFANLSADARLSSVQAAKGSVSSAAAIVHGKWLINPTTYTANGVPVEGATINVKNGYPDVAASSTVTAATGTIAEAAGLSSNDYKIDTTKTSGSVIVSPLNVTDATKCSVTYTPPSAAGGAPTITLASGDCS